MRAKTSSMYLRPETATTHARWLALALALASCGHEADTATVRPEPAATSAEPSAPQGNAPQANGFGVPEASPGATASVPAAAALKLY